MFGMDLDALELEGLKHLSLLNRHINHTKKALNKNEGGNVMSKARIKYVSVEALKKDATRASTPESGLFKGLKIRAEKKDQDTEIIKFIVLGKSDKKNDLEAFNLDLYNVMSIRMRYGETKELVVFKANDVDQEKAVDTLEGLVKELEADKRMVENDPEIIDIDTYTDLPAEFGDTRTGNKKSIDVSGATGTAGTTNIHGRHYPGYGVGGACGYDDSKWKEKQKKKDEEKKRQDAMRQTPTLIKRKGAKPQLKALNVMKKKVMSILAGEYEVDLPDLEEKEKTEEKGKKECLNCTNANYLDEPNMYLEVCKECKDGDNYDLTSAEYKKQKEDESEAAGAFPGDDPANYMGMVG
jgi:hypothetical protein